MQYRTQEEARVAPRPQYVTTAELARTVEVIAEAVGAESGRNERLLREALRADIAELRREVQILRARIVSSSNRPRKAEK